MATELGVPNSWDAEADIVVIGFGFAGAIASIEATDAGRDVLLLEKMPDPGGISITSGGGVRTATDDHLAFSYLKATCGGMTPDNVLRALAKGMTEVPEYMRQLGTVNGAEVRNVPYEANYPFPGADTFGFCMFGEIPNFDQFAYYPHARGLRGGARHFKVVEDNVHRRGIRVQLNTAAKRLITEPGTGRVIGVQALNGKNSMMVKARRGVILACGGFEADDELKMQFLQGKPIVSAAFRGNTGDGIRMAQHAGASLWHMWNVHGSYGFRHPDASYPFGIRLTRLPDWVPGKPLRSGSIMPWIVVDQSGNRYMNEYHPYWQDTGHRPMEFYDVVTQTYPRIPSYMILDSIGLKLYPLAIPSFNDPDAFYEWSEDNQREIDLGILRSATSVEELGFQIGVDSAVLRRTLDRWNDHCDRGEDKDFGRPGGSISPIRTPPYYFAAVWPLVSNTQGGPVHDEKWRVLDAFNQPIPGLFEAGELGGVFGHLYLGGGNLAECYVGGWTAAREAVKNEPWT